MEHLFAVATFGDILGQAMIAEVRIGECGDGFGVEAIDLGEHPPEAGAEQIDSLSKKEIETPAVVFEATGLILDTEGHGRRFGRHIEFAKEASEVWIGDMIKDHETGIDGEGLIFLVDGDRVGVSAGVIVFFEKGKIVPRVKKVGTPESGDS